MLPSHAVPMPQLLDTLSKAHAGLQKSWSGDHGVISLWEPLEGKKSGLACV